MNKILKHINIPTVTPQSQPIPGRESEMAMNNAGGFTFTIDCFSQFRRFLILGSEGGTYYASERKLTTDNLNCLDLCLKTDANRTVGIIADVVRNRLAPKRDYAIFAWVYILKKGDINAKRSAEELTNTILNTGTDLLHAAAACDSLGGWNTLSRRTFNSWYLNRSIDNLALQVTKYAQRDGWSHKDVLCCTHPKATDLKLNSLFRYITYGDNKPEIPLIEAVEKAKKATKPKQIIDLIESAQLVREHIPTQFLNDVGVWEALLVNMPIIATVRNLGKMTSIGLIKPLSKASKLVIEKLSKINEAQNRQIHPYQVLLALKTYEQGHGEKGSLKWNPDHSITSALDTAFTAAFDNVQPTGKRFMIGIDVSASMSNPIMNSPISCCMGATAMAMATIRSEPYCFAAAFNDGFQQLPINKSMSLKDSMKYTDSINGGGTDCSLPMIYALKNKIEVDTFCVYTDSETWAGRIQPVQALKQYRKEMGINSKLIVVAMTSTNFTIADPKDPGMLDICGFSADTPSVISMFSSGLI